jgi:hypothetical protein
MLRNKTLRLFPLVIIIGIILFTTLACGSSAANNSQNDDAGTITTREMTKEADPEDADLEQAQEQPPTSTVADPEQAQEQSPTPTTAEPIKFNISETGLYIETDGKDVRQLALLNDTLWIATESNVIAYELSSENSVTYTSANGLPGDQINTIAVCDIPETHILVGTDGGIGLYNPETDLWDIWNQENTGWRGTEVKYLECSRSDPQIWVYTDDGTYLHDVDQQTWVQLTGFGGSPVVSTGSRAYWQGGSSYFQSWSEYLDEEGPNIPGKPGAWKTIDVYFYFLRDMSGSDSPLDWLTRKDSFRDPDTGLWHQEVHSGIVFTVNSENETFFRNLGSMFTQEHKFKDAIAVFYFNQESGEISIQDPENLPAFYDDAIAFMEKNPDAILDNPINFIYEDFMDLPMLGFIEANPDAILFNFEDDYADNFPLGGNSQDIALASDGTIWLAADTLIKGQGDIWNEYQVEDIRFEHVVIAENGLIWGSGDYQICLFNPVTEQCEDIYRVPESRVVRDLITDGEGTLYVGANGAVFSVEQASD